MTKQRLKTSIVPISPVEDGNDIEVVLFDDLTTALVVNGVEFLLEIDTFQEIRDAFDDIETAYDRQEL